MLVSIQVVAFANTLRDTEANPLVRSARVSGTAAPPRELPDIVVITPAGLMGFTRGFGPACGIDWTKEGIVARYASFHCSYVFTCVCLCVCVCVYSASV
jgi:hypothetical protein